MKKIRSLLIAALFVISGAKAFAADATVTFVTGKVEVFRGEKWIPLQKGDTVAKSEMVSTGFQSEAKLKILDSVMYLGPVTRITIEELSSTGNKDNVNVYLKTGSARSQVKHVDNKRVDYKVHTPIAVASCRGTDWTIDDSNAVECYEGTVAVSAYIPPQPEDENPKVENANGDGDDGEENAEGENKEGESTDGDKNGEITDGDKSGTDSEGGKSDEVNTENEANGDNKKSEAGNKSEGEKKSASGSKKENTPSSSDGVLVKANQSVKVSNSSSVSAPVNNVVRTASAIVNAVATASSKETVSSSSTNVASVTNLTQDAASSPNVDIPENPEKKEPEEPAAKTGTVVVTFEIP